MTGRPGGERPEDEDHPHWVAGSVALLLLLALVFALYFLVPKLQGYWANTGTAPPAY